MSFLRRLPNHLLDFMANLRHVDWGKDIIQPTVIFILDVRQRNNVQAYFSIYFPGILLLYAISISSQHFKIHSVTELGFLKEFFFLFWQKWHHLVARQQLLLCRIVFVFPFDECKAKANEEVWIFKSGGSRLFQGIPIVLGWLLTCPLFRYFYVTMKESGPSRMSSPTGPPDQPLINLALSFIVSSVVLCNDDVF